MPSLSGQPQLQALSGFPNQPPSVAQNTPQIKNHTATFYNKKLYVFGGYDGKKNHSALRVFDTDKNQWMKSKKTVGV